MRHTPRTVLPLAHFSHRTGEIIRSVPLLGTSSVGPNRLARHGLFQAVTHRYTKSCLAAALLFCCIWTVSVSAAEKNSSYNAALESIVAVELGDRVAQLADPAMEGRESGTRGGKAAGDYLADRYAKLHLRGCGDKDGFFQSFVPNFRNVLAMLPGSDPKLREQIIVVCAHYDHVGYGGRGMSPDPYGSIHPGADDNASGASAVLELAKAFTLLSEPPKRSILFVNWDAEEKGLLGSKYWVAHPTVALDRIVAGLNLDMVGRLRDSQLLVVGTRTGAGWRRLLCCHNDAPGLQMDFSWQLGPNADHYPLFEHGVPVLLFHTGVHKDYHRATDLAKYINREGMQQITRMLFGVVYDLANGPTTPAYRAAAKYENPQTEKAVLAQSAKPAERFGAGWDEDAAVSGGVLVSNVKEGSPAELAGLRPGDCITRFAGRDIHCDDDFYGAVSAAASPAVHTIKRPGEKKPLDLTATLGGIPLQWGVAWRTDDAEPGTIIITCVVPGSPAAHAGLLVGDRIYRVAGRDFADEAAFAQLAKTPADSLQLLTERDGHLHTLTIQFRQTWRLFFEMKFAAWPEKKFAPCLARLKRPSPSTAWKLPTSSVC
jgi:hypothetical protein